MSDATSPPLDPSVAWLAAYALGLAHSENSESQRLTDMLEVTREHPELLAAAHRRLHGTEVAESGLCEDALHLLDRAMVRVGMPRTEERASCWPSTATEPT